MKVLIVLGGGPVQRYLVNLCKQSVVKEVKELISTNKYSEAAAVAFKRGDLARAVREDEISGLDADLILSKDAASWDLTR
jgi:hypothetical protein